jgi:subtilisin family serine protease
MRRALLSVLCLTLLAGTAEAQLKPGPVKRPGAAIDITDNTPRTWIIQLVAPPAVSEPALRAAIDGAEFDPQSAQVQQYTDALVAHQDELLRSVGAADAKIYSYRYTFNGFAAWLTPLQAQKLAARKDVLNVWEDRIKHVETNASAAFMGLDDPVEGLAASLGLRGEGVIIGVIDSGITPEHPSFRDTRDVNRPRICRSEWAGNTLLGLWLCRRFKLAEREVVYNIPPGWRGTCEAGENFGRDACNSKLIGARFYIDGFLQRLPLDNNEFISPRDADGHGTHIAATATGRAVQASIGGARLARISGIAPRAQVAAYKACWLEPGQTRGSCSTADLQRAIEDAVADGVHIINYSVGSSDASIRDPDDLALLAAVDAGVLAVVAAGNDGPVPGSILSPAGAPWVLTVGASTRSGQRFDEAVRIDSPSDLAGLYAVREASFTPALRTRGPVTARLVLANDGFRGISGNQLGSEFDACEDLANGEAMKDNVALVQRGFCNFDLKVRNAELAGAKAVIVWNNQGAPITMSGVRNSSNIPAVMIGQADGEKLFGRLQAGTAIEVTLDKRLVLREQDEGNVVAAFSSRGPNLVDLDLLKPDVTAPGVEILAAQTPDVANGLRGENYQYLSGTSMAVPHVAGLAALLREARPDWSPAALKSALMTTARQDLVTEEDGAAAGPFAFGAGHVVPNAALRPGLVYESGTPDYDAFLCGRGEARVSSGQCAALAEAGFATDAVDLNLPSVAVGNLVTRRSVRRRVTNLGEAAQFVAEVESPPGTTVSVQPSLLSLGQGESAEFSIDIEAGSAPLYEWQAGSFSWSSGSSKARSPLVLRPLPFLAPLEVGGSGTAGTLGFDLQFGYDGTYFPRVHGLAAPQVFSRSVQNDPDNNYVFRTSPPPHVARVEVSVPAGTLYLRIATFDELTDGDDDLDLYVYYCPVRGLCNELIGVSGEATSEERVDIVLPEAGWYLIDVHGFATDDAAGGPGANFDLLVWQFGLEDDRGNLIVTGSPASAAAGTSGRLDLSWNLPAAGRYLGAVTHNDAEGALDLTLVEIISATE